MGRFRLRSATGVPVRKCTVSAGALYQRERRKTTLMQASAKGKHSCDISALRRLALYRVVQRDKPLITVESQVRILPSLPPLPD
jgi:hypothetical protein